MVDVADTGIGGGGGAKNCGGNGGGGRARLLAFGLPTTAGAYGELYTIIGGIIIPIDPLLCWRRCWCCVLWVCCVRALWYDLSESTIDGGLADADLDLALDWDRMDVEDEFVGIGAGTVADLLEFGDGPRAGALELPRPPVVAFAGGDGGLVGSTSIQS